MLISAKDFSEPVQLVDAEQILALAQNAGAETAMVIVDAFKNSNDEILIALAEQIATSNFDDAAKSAHALKGSSGNLGATGIAAQARLIEDACKNSDQSRLLELVDELPATIADTIETLEAIIATV